MSGFFIKGIVTFVQELWFRKDGKHIKIKPDQTTTYTADREIQLPKGDVNHNLMSDVSENTVQNKTINAALNTVTNIGTDEIEDGYNLLSDADYNKIDPAYTHTTSDGSSHSDVTLNTSHRNASSEVHGLTGSVVGTSDAQDISNKDIDGGTASDNNRITLPKNTKANLDDLTRKEATIVYATDKNKIYVDNGSELQVSGGGLIPVQVTVSGTTPSIATFVSGNLYLVDMDGATGDVTVAIEAGAAEKLLDVIVFNQGSNVLILEANGSEQIYHRGDTDTDISMGELVNGLSFAWETNTPQWIATAFDNLPTQNFAGDFNVDGTLTVNDGVIVSDEAGQSTLNYYRTVDVGYGGDFTSGDIKITRIGNVVTISFNLMGHGSNASPTYNCIPSWAVPSDDRRNCYNTDASSVTCIAEAQADGDFIIRYYSDPETGVARTSSLTGGHISYIV